MINSVFDQLREKLIFDLASTSKTSLSPFVRLMLIHQLSGLDEINQRWIVDLFLKCGCFSEAMQIFENLGHWRKIGDLAWIQGDFSKAETSYSKPENHDNTIYRSGKDWDRLIKLYFYQSNWEKVITTIQEANIESFDEKKIVLGNSVVSSKPYLKMAAVAVAKTRMTTNASLCNYITNTFSIQPEEWRRLIATSEIIQIRDLNNTQKKCAPRIAQTPITTLQQALNKGSTAKSEKIASLFKNLESIFLEGLSAITSYFKSEDLNALKPLFNILSTFSDESLCKTYIFAVLKKCKNTLKSIGTPELVAQFYESHPLIKRMYFGELLFLKFAKGIPVNASDILTGLLQHIISIEEDIKALSGKKGKNSNLIEFEKIVSFSEWIEMKIGIWLNSDGKPLLTNIISLWNSGNASYVKTPFKPKKHYPKSPREMVEWKELLNECHKWLSSYWHKEIGIDKWLSEKTLYELIKRKFTKYKVIRHAQPVWLEPQHFDIFIPELSLAIEYMGEQHYRPINIFGGKQTFEATLLRDKRKVALCSQAGVYLFVLVQSELDTWLLPLRE